MLAMSSSAEVCTLNFSSLISLQSEWSTCDFRLFAFWSMHSVATILWIMKTWNTVCVNGSDISAKSFTWPEYIVWCKGGKSVLIMTETLWENNLKFVRYVLIIYVSIVIIVGKKIGVITFLLTFICNQKPEERLEVLK